VAPTLVMLLEKLKVHSGSKLRTHTPSATKGKV
jgi:hypothetical protein